MKLLASVVFAACALLSSGRAQGEPAPGTLILLLVGSGEDNAAEWFGSGASDALLAATLALRDHRNSSTTAAVGSGDRPTVVLQFLEERFLEGMSLGLNDSVVAVVSAECTNETCIGHTSWHGKPVISVSPSCLRGSANGTSSSSSEHPAIEALSGWPLCMTPSLLHLSRGITGLLSHYHWQRATIITELDSQLVPNAESLYQELSNAGITKIKQSSLSPLSPLTNVLDRDYRIVILNSTPVLSRLVLCQALSANLSRHVWITPGWYPHNWWKQGESPVINSQSACLDRDLEQFLTSGGRVLSVLQSPPYSSSTASMSVLLEVFQQWCVEAGVGDCVYAGLAYDAVWAILNGLTATLNHSGGDLQRTLSDSNFTGVSGQVEFDSQSYRVLGGYTLGQMRDSPEGGPRVVPVATLTEDGEGGLKLRYLPGETEQGVWPGGVPPDGSPQEELKYPLTVLVVLCWVLSGTVILWALGCIIFQLCFREKKLIKLTSPTLNLMIAVGIILTNLSTPLSMYPPALEQALPTFCIVRTWLLPIGWSLSLCTITVKMWRVFVIYRTTKRLQSLKEKKMRKFLQDGYMVALVLCMVVVDVIVLIIGTSLPETRFTPKRVPDREFSPYRNGDDVQVVYYNLQCVSEKGLIWVALLFGYKIIFLVSGVVLAILSRKVKVKGLNESREVQVTMIITTPVVITGLILRLVLSDYLNVVGTLYALTSSLYGGLVLGIIFLPKMISLCKNPSGDQIFMSKLQLNSSIPNDDRERSLTSTSLVSFNPSNSLKSSLFRKSSMESGLGSSIAPAAEDEGKTEREKRNNASVKHAHFALPTIEEATCSNEPTTTDSSDGVGEGKPFLLIQQEGGSSADDDQVDLVVTNGNPATCLRNFNYSEDGCEDLPSPVEGLFLSQEQKNVLRDSWSPHLPPSLSSTSHLLTRSTSSSPPSPTGSDTPTDQTTNETGLAWSQTDSSGTKNGPLDHNGTTSGATTDSLQLNGSHSRSTAATQSSHAFQSMFDSSGVPCANRASETPPTATPTLDEAMVEATHSE